MEKISSVLSYADDERISTTPRVIVEWPQGLSGAPVIFPLGGSDELDEQIRKTLKQAFTRLQADHAGTQNVAI